MPNPNLTEADLPPIYISEAHYDDMGAILDRLGIEYSPVESVSLANLSDAIVLLNCSFSWRDEIDKSEVEGFVERGGTLMASDLTAPAISSFTRARFQSGDWGDYVPARIEDQEMVELLGQDQIELDFDTAIKEPTKLPNGATPLLRAENRNSVIAYKFSYGQGQAVYTTFHNHSQPSEVEDALLQVLLMVPIAESTGSTVTETYTTLVEDVDESEDDETALIDADSGNTTVIYDQTNEDDTETDVITHDETIEVRFALKSGDDEIARSIPAGETLQLGRTDFNGFVDEDIVSYISRDHFELRYQDSSDPLIEIRDTDSANGTKIGDTDISDGGFYNLKSGATLNLAKGYITLELSY